LPTITRLHELARELNAYHHRGEARGETRRRVREQRTPILDELPGLEPEGGERGEAAEHAGDQREPRGGRDPRVLVGECRDHADQETAGHVHRERAPRKARPGARFHPEADRVAQHRADPAAREQDPPLHRTETLPFSAPAA
jgi:hypothetical protein